MCQDPQSDLFGVSNWPLTGLSDLILGSQKVTLKVLVYSIYIYICDHIWFLLKCGQAAAGDVA